MKSRAALGDHPIHPALVPFPIGAFFLALVGDVTYLVTRNPFWWDAVFYCIGVGILTALLAAIAGFVDYFGVHMSQAGRRVATIHMALNLVAVALYVVSFLLRLSPDAVYSGRWIAAIVFEMLPFLMLGVSGWLGGNLIHKHKVGVIEEADPEATAIGRHQEVA